MSDLRLALGLMSGTSLDGIDVALIESDGAALVKRGGWLTVPYEEELRAGLRNCLGGSGDIDGVTNRITHAHGAAVAALLAAEGLEANAVHVIGFHGHTIAHRPEERMTWQIGDGALLSQLTGINVVCDFRSNDVAAGGQGAPLAPLYHAALAEGLDRPLAVLNLGGVGNITWLGEDGGILAFDTGPGNALLDDWMRRHLDVAYDADGALGRSGVADRALVERLLCEDYFERKPPKSLDRDDFTAVVADLFDADLSVADGAATLTAFTVGAVARAVAHLPGRPQRWLVTGGGRHNPTMMAGLAAALSVPVEPVESVGWNGDAIEAQAFAYLALRSLDDLPLTLPTTTGAPSPLTGGVLYRS
ncbi:MAG: anhydro-N-acetylmuramic acid kinase [Alphaproteobacteria bacterium]